MAFTLVNSIISLFLKKRKHQIELFLKYPIDVQHELLLKLVNSYWVLPKIIILAKKKISRYDN